MGMWIVVICGRHTYFNTKEKIRKNDMTSKARYKNAKAGINNPGCTDERKGINVR